MTARERVAPYAMGSGPAALPWANGRPPAVEQPRRAFVAQIMGLPMSIHVRGPRATSQPVATAVAAAFDRLRSDDRTFSTYRSHSAVSRIRRGELAVEDAGPRVREVVALCAEATRRTDGTFSAWLPGPDGRPAFDPTGLVKGWAVEQAFGELTDRLARLDRYDALVSAGGDVLVACARTDTPDWTVGVEDPHDRQRVLRTVRLRRGAVATSGLAARGHHIVDPATQAPATDLASVTVVGPSLTWADVYATAAFVQGERAIPWLATLPDHGGIVVAADGTVRTT